MSGQECEHELSDVGPFRTTGPRSQIGGKILYCARCGHYLAQRTIFLDFGKLPPGELSRMQHDEYEDRMALVERHRAVIAAGGTWEADA